MSNLKIFVIISTPTREVTCRYTPEEETNRAIASLSRIGWVVKRRYQEGDYYYPTDPGEAPHPNPGLGGL